MLGKKTLMTQILAFDFFFPLGKILFLPSPALCQLSFPSLLSFPLSCLPPLPLSAFFSQDYALVLSVLTLPVLSDGWIAPLP